jgi:hypothetical protein
VAIMGTLTWGAIARSFDAYETVTEIDQRYHNVRVALNRMAREISMAFLTQPTRNLGPEEMWRTLFVAKSGTYYQLDFTRPGIRPLLPNSRTITRDSLNLR